MAWTAIDVASDAKLSARLIAARPRLEGPPKSPLDEAPVFAAGIKCRMALRGTGRQGLVAGNVAA
jgi:hypothetical protein